ncbi:MAG TPA: glycosyltransferase, partial [Candidatus Saccharimonadales bacterium]
YENMVVYILDDSPGCLYKEIAGNIGVQYISRPNHGVDKKSGNLNYALEHVPESDHVLVLDADFKPHKDMLREMVPYAAPDIALVQTPQHFELSDRVFKRSKIEYGAGYTQREFFSLTQVARDRFGAAICVGTNALYNRPALEAVNGFARVEHSEDVITGLLALNHMQPNGEPYRIRYLPLQLATGTSPNNYYSFFRQQNRWATGTIGFAFRSLFSKTLRPTQKVIYFSNCLYYLYTLSMLFLPLQVLAFISSSGRQFDYVYLFIPQIIMRLVIMPYVLRRKHRRLATIITVTASAFIFLQAFYMLLARRTLGWEITGGNTNAKHRHMDFWRLKAFATVYYFVMYIGTFVLAITTHSIGLNGSIALEVLFGFSIVAQTIHMIYMHLHDVDETSPRLSKLVLPVKSFSNHSFSYSTIPNAISAKFQSISKSMTEALFGRLNGAHDIFSKMVSRD